MSEPEYSESQMALADVAYKSGFFAVKSPEQAYILLSIGRELGLPGMQALRAVHIMNGRVMLASDTMVACVRRSGLCLRWEVMEDTDTAVTVLTQRKGSEPETIRWTLEDAKRAGVLRNTVWGQYPRQMLYHRAAADLARRVYPDVLVGCYDPREIPAEESAPVRGEVSVAVAPRELEGPTPRGMTRAEAMEDGEEATAGDVSPAVQRLAKKILSSTIEQLLEGAKKLDAAVGDGQPAPLNPVEALMLQGAYVRRWCDLIAALDQASAQQVAEHMVARIPERMRAWESWVLITAVLEPKSA